MTVAVSVVFWARTASVSPIRSSTSRATPRTSTFCPPSRNSGARSSTVTSQPVRRSQNAAERPAMLAPEITACRVVMSAPASCGPTLVVLYSEATSS